MATVAREKSAVVRRGARQEVEVDVAAPSRREFLYYIWGASVVLLLGESTAGLVWFSLPRFREGEFGGVFNFPGEEVPAVDTSPTGIPEGRLWLSNSDVGFLALYAVCTHLGCLPKWNLNNFRFECPCHGSRFEIDGDYIQGPAPRGLDRFATTVTFTDGSTATSTDGQPIDLNGRTVAAVSVNTGSRITGPSR